MRGIRISVFISIMLALAFSVSAQAENSGHVKLLAVQETAGGYRGSIADLYLQITPGDGRVFLDTFPLSKIDTQISTRFAKEMVCNFLDIDCSKYDFFYTIRSDSVIVGGPSAGAAIAALTLSTLEDLDINESITVSGTINSGGLIGPVSGLKPKIDAASQNGIGTVLVPGGRILYTEDNETIDLVDYGEDRGVIVKEVNTLEDVVLYISGKDYERGDDFTIPSEYTDTMKYVAEVLCNKTALLHQMMVDLTDFGFGEDELAMAHSLMDSAINLTSRAESSIDLGQYYSAASYCFGANIRYQNIILLQKNLTNISLAETIQNTENHIQKYEAELENTTFRTLTDFETYMIIKERILTAKDFLENAKSAFYSSEYDALYNLAYAIERFDSAKIWEAFFDTPGKEFEINDDVIKDSCIQKISEAQERYQYVQLFLPASLEDVRRNIERAMGDYKSGNYDLCVSKASNAKATVNVLLGVMGIPQENVPELVERKLESVKKIIFREQEKGIFPILGYSYYQYADSLKETDLYSSLIYAEQALELSTLDIYFEETSESKRLFSLNASLSDLITFLFGIMIGIVVILIILPSNSRYKRFLRRKKIRKRF